MSSNITLSVVVPAYQEASTVELALKRTAAELSRLDVSYEIILVSDGSTDGTGERARRTNITELSVVEYSRNQGKGHAMRVGAEKASGSLVAFIDADLDIHPSGIGRLLSDLRRYNVDAVVGSKVHRESHVSYPPFRRIQSRVFRSIVRMGFHLDVADSQTGLKLFKREVLVRCLPLVRSTGYVFDLELLVLANDAGYRIAEGPVDLDYQFSTTTGARATVAMLCEVVRLHRYRARSIRAGLWPAPAR